MHARHEIFADQIEKPFQFLFRPLEIFRRQRVHSHVGNARVERVVQEQAMKLQRMGLDDLRKDQAQEEKREEAKKEALETLRPQVFLMALAQKENITVNDQEVEMAIYGMAMRAQQDYKKVSEAYHKSGLIYELRDRILADKALEMVYSKAKINEVPAVSLSEPKNAD